MCYTVLIIKYTYLTISEVYVIVFIILLVYVLIWITIQINYKYHAHVTKNCKSLIVNIIIVGTEKNFV